MAEFVEGFDKLAKIGPCVSIFGSARTTDDNPYFKVAQEIAAKLVRHGYGVITGGGPGIMEAANKGAFEQGGRSVGLNIKLPFEQHSNIYILDELFEALTLIQTKKIGRFPIILVGKAYWSGLIDWIKSTVLEAENNINAPDLKLFSIVETPDEAVHVIEEFYSKYLLKPNF